MSIGAAAAALLVEAFLEAPGAAAALSLPGKVGLDKCSITISVAVPAFPPAGSSVCINSLSVHGRLVAGFTGPLAFAVQRSMKAPLRLELPCSGGSMTISAEAQLYFALDSSPSGVFVVDSDGVALTPLPDDFPCIGRRAMRIAFASCDPPMLLLAPAENGPEYADCRLYAMDAVARTVLWESAPGLLKRCSDITALPEHGIAVVASEHRLFAHSLRGGMREGSLRVTGFGGHISYDWMTGMMFGDVARESDR